MSKKKENKNMKIHEILIKLSLENILYFLVKMLHKEECDENVYDVYYREHIINKYFYRHNPKPIKGIFYARPPDDLIFLGTCFIDSFPVNHKLVFLK